MGTLTWNRIGESLGRSGAACQLHWKTMKNMNTIKSHIEYIKIFSNNNDKNYQITKESLLAIHNKYINSNYHHNHHINLRTKSSNFDDNIDIDLLKTVDNVLKANQWRCSMLDILWNNVLKELEKDKNKDRNQIVPTPSPSISISLSNIKTETLSSIDIINNNDNNPPNTHCPSSSSSDIKTKKIKKDKRKKDKKKKKHKKKKHHRKHKSLINNDNIDMMIKNDTLLSLKEDDKQRRSSRSNARWTRKEEETLIKMLAQPNNSIDDIAKELGRSTNAINQHRLAMKHKHAKLRHVIFIIINQSHF